MTESSSGRAEDRPAEGATSEMGEQACEHEAVYVVYWDTGAVAGVFADIDKARDHAADVAAINKKYGSFALIIQGERVRYPQ